MQRTELVRMNIGWCIVRYGLQAKIEGIGDSESHSLTNVGAQDGFDATGTGGLAAQPDTALVGLEFASFGQCKVD